MKKISQSGIRAENIRAILNVMINAGAEVSRSEISEKTGLSLMTVGKVADGLIMEGIAVQSKPATGNAGRRAGVLSLTRKHFFLIINVSDTKYTASALDLCLSEIDHIDYKYNDTLTEEDNMIIFFREASFFLLRMLHDYKLAGSGICSGTEKEDLLTAGDPCKIMKKAVGFDADFVTDFLSASVLSCVSVLSKEDRICTMHLVLGSAPCGCIASDGKRISERSDFSALKCYNGETLLHFLDAEKDEEKLAEKLCSSLHPIISVLSPRALFIDTASRSYTEGFPDYVKNNLNSSFPSLKVFFDDQSKKQSDIGIAKALRRTWIDKLSSGE